MINSQKELVKQPSKKIVNVVARAGRFLASLWKGPLDIFAQGISKFFSKS
jgi:hypothetical protein